MIVVTGAAGFIGSVMVGKLNKEGYNDIIAVDEFTHPEKNKNLEGKKLTAKVDRDKFFNWLKENNRQVEFIFHLGARTDTTEFDVALLNRLNLDYTKKMWESCIAYGIPLVYASSAATYGGGEHGYSDNENMIPLLQPLNPYGVSKNEFDKWALQQAQKPYYWVGLKFFNVYGPNEYHKGRMASVIWHAYNQIRETGEMKLFRSHNPNFRDGGQMRDFVYVMDVVEVLYFLMHHRKKSDSGIYNLGSGHAETFLELVKNTFKAMNLPEKISFVDTPADIRDKYQYFTEADMAKLRGIGYIKDFAPLSEGVEDYVKKYLLESRYF